MAGRKRGGSGAGGAAKRKLPRFDPGPSGRFAARVLRELGVPGALIGRLAVWAWIPDEGEHAFTKDLDVAVRREDLPRIRAWIEKQGLSARELGIGGVNVRAPETAVNVDFVDRTSPEFGDLGLLFGEAIEAARVRVDVGGASLRLVPAEHLLAMKIATGEPDDARDAERLLLHAGVDVAAARKIVAAHLGALGMGVLEALLRQVGHPDARPKRKSE
jgi:hypothetical protein